MAGTEKKVDAVFEGGGVKGTGLVGAVAVTEEKGYSFENVAGTSAGAIVAAFIAAGYTAAEMKEIMFELDYNEFRDKGVVDRLPLIGPILSLGFEKGIYEGDRFEEWLGELLAAKGVRTFGDLFMEEYKQEPKYRYKLSVIAADITNGRMLVLPRDIEKYGVEPNSLRVVRAVRMSMSIPFFFEPIILQDAAGDSSYIVDGGILSNYPVWLFDADTADPPWPTFGYKLVEPSEGSPRTIRGPISMFAALFATMMEAHDARYIEDADFARTIPIPTLGVRTTEFGLSPERKEALYESGRSAAEDFLERWDFEVYKDRYRRKEPAGRSARV